MQRRDFFHFLRETVHEHIPHVQEHVLRPPYYKVLTDFGKTCQECSAPCVDACEESIISLDTDKTPRLSFHTSGCSYCDACAIVCEPNVLQVSYKSRISTPIYINEVLCMSHQGVMCFSCQDPCLENAIPFQAMFMPHIDQEKCSSCGFCVSRCPSQAIQLQKKDTK